MALEYLNMTGRRVLLFITIFLFISFRSFSAVFTVTSNAASGPGTLREALTLAAANGIAEKDFIYFNLPDLSEAGRTITTFSSLPDISSNLVIDGTTQPGNKFGVSDTKIIIQPSNTNDTYDPFLLTNVNGFEMYGLYIRDFIGVFPFEGSAVLYVHSCKNIQIGAPGKGNIFSNNAYVLASIYGHYYGNTIPPVYDGIENLTVYSNFFGFEPDGKSFRNMAYGYNATLDLSGCAGTIQIGGDNDNQRNYFGNAAMPIECKGTTPQTNHPTTFVIKNNFFNYNVSGLPAPLPYFNGSNLFTVRISDNEPYADPLILPYTVYLQNNKIQAPCGLSVGIVTGDIICQGNQVNKEESLNNATFASGGINFQSQKRVIIGGENPGEANTFYNSGIYASSPISVLIQRNSDYCINNGFNVVWQTSDLLKPKLPVIAINNITSSSVSGTATPLSKVELFWDDDCQNCLPLTYITTVTTNAGGNWIYNGNIQKGVIASATINGYTSLFTAGAAAMGGKVNHSTCGLNNGSISDISFQYTGNYTWKNEQGQIIAQTPNLQNLSPGKYTLTAGNGTCSSDYTFEIFDATPDINDSQIQILQPSCNNGGSITNLYLNNYNVFQNDFNAYTYKWVDQGNNVKSTTLDLTNAEPGTYKLIVTYKNQCPVTYGPIILKSVKGPNIDQTHASIQSTACGQSTGFIKNIIVTGTGNVKYSWLNAQHQEVATSNDLTNQPAGIYTFKVTDDSQCGEIYSSEINIPETNGITLDEHSVTRVPATCSQNNGSIQGITAPGATHYNWINTNNNSSAGTNPELLNAAAGNYRLTASNDFGCSKTSQVYTIDAIPVTVYPNYAANITNSCSGQNSGSITLTTDPLVKTMRWIDGNGQPAGTDANPHGLKPDTYKVYFTDASGCETLYPHDFTVNEIDPLQIVVNSETRTDDQCGLNTGSIKNIQVKGGTQPYTYLWLNVAGEHLVTSQDLTDVGAGDYTLQVQDASGCGVMASRIYTVLNENSSIDAPVIAPLQLCAPGEALLSVSSPSAGNTYRLYDSQTSTQYQDEQTNGIFKIKANPNSTYYISKVNGQCESERTQAQITISLSAIDIPNAFTPNGDGKNDYWKINNAQNYPQAIVQIFTRYGQKVFESKGYSVPFDGTYNGTKLPSGVYYYILNLGKSCNLLSGSLSIIR